MTQEEFSRLLQSARSSNELIQCYDGETRARIYTGSYYTGLRRNELANLTPESFDLDGTPPTLTVLATVSKHRRTDILPLHPEFVILVREWVKGLRHDQVLFPTLGKRRTWRMVKIDLERAGIPYTTPDGVADFHAVGRHTHVTELFRNGVTLPEAQKLARHSDIKMAMKYAHIGIEDQAKAVARLPNPCQHIGSISGIPEGHQQAPGVTERQSDQSADQIATPCEVALSGTDGQKKTPPDKGGVLWRRRESNPRPVAHRCPLLRA